MTISTNTMTVTNPEDIKYFKYAKIVKALFKIVHIVLLLVVGICIGFAMIMGINKYILIGLGFCAFLFLSTLLLNHKLDCDMKDEIYRLRNEQDDIILCEYENCMTEA